MSAILACSRAPEKAGLRPRRRDRRRFIISIISLIVAFSLGGRLIGP
ncbi:MAG TPA: hypothetical protein PLS69_03600 [Terricaulis sp.]|nr:hypothetical protein [Terricaulis sp.]HRP11472.1 hypothetical protein [Terricaulis sp.]